MSARNLAELILLAAVWGASYLFMRIAAPEFGPIALIEIRVAIAALFLLPFWLVRDAKMNASLVREKWVELTVIGTLNSAIPFVLFAYSTLYITGGFASILNSTVPIWGALVAWFWLGQRLNLDSSIGLGLGLFGVAILVSQTLGGNQAGTSLGAAAAVLASVLYGIAANYTSVKLNNVSALSIATFSQIAAAILLLPAAIATYPSTPISLNSWLSVIALGVVCTGFAYTMYFRLIANVGSTKAITVTFLIPIFGSLWGALVIDEVITTQMIIGTLVILIGTGLVNGVISLKRRKAPNE